MKRIVNILLSSVVALSVASTATAGIKRINPDNLVDTRQFGFSQIVITPPSGHTVYISGQFAGDEDGNLIGKTVEEQMQQSFKNLKTAIKASGAKPEQVVQIRVLIVDHQMKYLEPLERELSGLFGKKLPASTLIPVPRLALDGMLFEIEATLFIPAK
ncbi:RidA family protein [Parendozoicomonas haliclonae]|uniref:Enamine/imine deaminase n=1 Tax=Parendozoicomonas haliclonae TaxID=1960125 RepID=A0A1X7ADX5_9GAMM|nr:RidA family protein [Parendozoicomonas haliclonae]SMA32921.1 Enamine/imine deaminase [Parendozoicomonas haliclonae]